MTPSGMETATFRFVAQHLNHGTTVKIIEGSSSGRQLYVWVWHGIFYIVSTYKGVFDDATC